MHGFANFRFKDKNLLNLCANHQNINIAYKFSTLAATSNTVNDNNTYIIFFYFYVCTVHFWY